MCRIGNFCESALENYEQLPSSRFETNIGQQNWQTIESSAPLDCPGFSPSMTEDWATATMDSVAKSLGFYEPYISFYYLMKITIFLF